MPFDQSSITSSRATPDAGRLWISWTSTAPPGAGFQVYVDGRLAWRGVERRCVLPAPAGRARVAIGSVGDGELGVDFSASLPTPPPARRPSLSWLGGSYLDPTGGDDVAGFRVYGSAAPGGPVDLSRPLAELAAYEDGVIQDGWDLGGWGEGGWGKAPTRYSWTGRPLARGVWSFEVRAFDAVGSESPAASGSLTIGGPPGPPARDAAGRRLTYSYDPGTGVATLHWLPPED